MSQQQVLLGLSSSFLVDSVDFDGSTWLSLTPGTAITDGKTGTFSGWFRKDGNDGAFGIMLGSTTSGSSRWRARFNNNNTVGVNGNNATPTQILQLSSGGTFTASATWHHLIMSWDMANTSNRYLYVDDASSLSVGTYTNDTLDYGNDWGVGAFADGSSPSSACFAELWFSTAFLNLSDAATRRKFVTAGVKPVDLGSDGSNPGVAPEFYLSLRKGQSVSNFYTNRGSAGGTFSVASGTPAVGSTSPSD